jgi:hypothetical protein
MAVTGLSPVYDDFLNFVVEKATPQQILDYRLSEASQRRAVYLTERRKAGTLTSDEALELEQMLELDLLLSALKAKALKAVSIK